MPRFARTIHFDLSDQNVFERPAMTGEWAISGGFEFSNWTDTDLVGKKRQAFANGWLGLDTFGRATFIAVAQIEEAEIAALVEGLAAHFVEVYGAPDLETARTAAREEIGFMAEMCADQRANTLFTVHRELTEAGVREQFRQIQPQDAELVQVAVHGTYD